MTIFQIAGICCLTVPLILIFSVNRYDRRAERRPVRPMAGGAGFSGVVGPHRPPDQFIGVAMGPGRADGTVDVRITPHNFRIAAAEPVAPGQMVCRWQPETGQFGPAVPLSGCDPDAARMNPVPLTYDKNNSDF